MVKNTVSVTVVIGSATPPGRLRRAVEEALERAQGGGDAAADLDTLLAAVTALARATGGLTLGGARPLPKRPRPART